MNLAMHGCLKLALFSLSVFTSSAFASSGREYTSVSICDILLNPAKYSGERVYFRGVIYKGVDITNISDPSCRDHVIKISIGKDVYEHKDVEDFYEKINSWGMRGFATVAGSLSVSDSQIWPYTLYLEKVWGVEPLE